MEVVLSSEIRIFPRRVKEMSIGLYIDIFISFFSACFI